VSGLISGISHLFGGNSAKTDRGQTLTSYGQLNNVFNTGFNGGTNAVGAGNQNLGAAGGYYNKILSGNRSAMQEAVQPESSAIQARADAQRRQQGEMGTARGGGVAGTNQQQDTNTNAATDNALFAARPGAAAGAAGVGGQQVGEGLS